MKGKNHIKILLSFFLCLLLLMTQTSCSKGEKVEDTGFYLDTTCTIEIDNMSKKDGMDLIENTFKECDKYEHLFSRTLEGSDIYRINHAKGDKVQVSDETLEVIEDALVICKESNGLFDITVGQLTNLWNFSSDTPKVPSQSSIDKALKTIDYNNIIIEGNTVQLKNPDTWLELGAIAKGYIADQLAAYLKDNGVTSGLVNLGGNIVTIGQSNNGDDPWNIGIAAPYTHHEDVIGSVYMVDETLVTSGVYERFFEENGKKYHHVLNPKTGYPVDTDILGISIKGKSSNSTWCDGYSTTCLLLGSEKAQEYMKNKSDFSYVIITTDGKVKEYNNFELRAIE